MSELITVRQLANKLNVPKNKVSYQSRKLDDGLIVQRNGVNYLTERAQLLITQAIRDLMNPLTDEDVELDNLDDTDTPDDSIESDEIPEDNSEEEATEEIPVEDTDEDSEESPAEEVVEESTVEEAKTEEDVNEEVDEIVSSLYERIDSLEDQIEVFHQQLITKDEQIEKITQLLDQSQQLQLQLQQQLQQQQVKLVEDTDKKPTWLQRLFGKS